MFVLEATTQDSLMTDFPEHIYNIIKLHNSDFVKVARW